MSRRPNIFERIQVIKPKRNKFDLSHEKKLSMQMGALVPTFYLETMPGDKIRVGTEQFFRLAPMLAPIMHRVDVYTHYFKVPMRLVWDEWEDFITGGEDGESAPVYPYFDIDDVKGMTTNVATGSLLDYMGFPVQNIDPLATQNLPINALPFRAYNLIWNEYYRDQTIMAEIEFSKASGQITDSTELDNLITLRDRVWEKDYFTSALPWPQRGPEMLVPVSTQVTNGRYLDGSLDPDMAGPIQIDATGTVQFEDRSGVGLEPGYLEGLNATATIADLRTAIAIQQWLEKNARGGSRYIEQILHHFGVISSDSRLQRPEYLGGAKHPIKISEVLSTVEGTEPQGNMAGHGIAAGTLGFTTYCEEHCMIFGITSIMPKPAYMDGVNRNLQPRTKFEYPWPELAHLGEQPINVQEIYWDSNFSPTPEQMTWGYQSRYSDFKFMPDTVHGDFRTTYLNWHMARKFTGNPTLSEPFLVGWPTQRIFAVTDTEIHKVYAQIYHHVDALRPLPYFGTPGLTSV